MLSSSGTVVPPLFDLIKKVRCKADIWIICLKYSQSLRLHFSLPFAASLQILGPFRRRVVVLLEEAVFRNMIQPRKLLALDACCWIVILGAIDVLRRAASHSGNHRKGLHLFRRYYIPDDQGNIM